MKSVTQTAPETLFQALADRTRLRLLSLMRGGEVCVCLFVEALQLPQPTISRHLAYLREAGLITGRREGKWIHYRIAEPMHPAAAQVLTDTLRWLEDDAQIQQDYRRLKNLALTAPVPLKRAARPQPIGEDCGHHLHLANHPNKTDASQSPPPVLPLAGTAVS